MVPGPTDVVCITTAGTYKVTLNASTSVLALVVGAGSGTGSQTLDLVEPNNTGQLTLSLTGNTSLTGSTVAAGGTLLLDQSYVSGAVTVSVATGATFTNATGGTITSQDTSSWASAGRTLSGTFVNDGSLNVDVNTSWSGALSSDGTLTTGSGATLSSTASSDTLTLSNPGSVTNSGGISVGTATLDWNGGQVTGSPIAVASGTLNFPGSFAGCTTGCGQVDVEVSPTLNGNIPAGVTVDALGVGNTGTTTLSVPNSLSNDGTLLLDQSFFNDAVVVSVGSGATLTNAAGGTITSQDTASYGSAGRTLSGTFVNDGTLNVDVNTSWSGSLASDGTLTTGSGATLSSTNATDTLTLSNPGSVTNSGGISVGSTATVGTTLDWNGGTVTGSPITLTSGTINFPGSFAGCSTGCGQVNVGDGTSKLVGNIPAGVTVETKDNANTGTTTFSVPNSLTNYGTLLLDQGYNNDAVTVSVGTGATFTNAAGGTITSQDTTSYGSAGRTLSGTFVNDGSLNVDVNTSWSGSLASDGTLTTGGGALSATAGSDTLTLSAPGSVTNSGGISVGTGTLDWNGGTVSGSPITMASGTLNFPVSFAGCSTGCGQVNVGDGTSTLAGNIPAGVTVETKDNANTGTTTLSVPNSLTNYGTLLLDQGYNNDAVVVSVGSGATFTNAAGGTITSQDTSSWASAGRTLIGTFVNQGAVNFATASSIVPTGTSFINRGSLDVESGVSLTLAAGQIFTQAAGGGLVVDGTLSLQAATFDYQGGTISGANAASGFTILNGTLDLASHTAASIPFYLEGGSTLTGGIPAGQVVDALGIGNTGTTSLSVPNSLSNHGTLLLDQSYYNDAVVVLVGSGAKLTNAAGGTITSQDTASYGSAGRTLSGTFVNDGSLNVDVNTSWSGSLASDGTLTTGSGATLSSTKAADTLTLSNPGSVTNSGGISVGTATLDWNGGQVTGSPITVASGTLNFPGSFAGCTTGCGQVDVEVSPTLNGNIPAGVTVDALGVGSTGTTTLSVPNSLSNDGTLVLDQTYFNDAVVVSVGSGATFTNAAGGTITSQDTSSWASAGRTMSGTFVNHGLIDSLGVATTVSGDLQNLDTTAGALTGGTFEANNGTLTLPASSPVTDNEATVELVNGGNLLDASGAQLLTLATNGGTLSLNHATLVLSGGLTNTGNVSLLDGGTLTAPSYSQSGSGAVTDINQPSGTTTSTLNLGSGTFSLGGGVLSGDGQVSGTVDNSGGTVEPGSGTPHQIGTFTVSGAYSQGSGGTLDVNIAGAGSNDQLSAASSSLGGNSQIFNAAGYLPAEGATFPVVAGNPGSTSFATVDGRVLSPSEDYDVVYDSSGAHLVAVTKPTAPTGLIASGGSGSVTIGFSQPTDNGGSAITQYTVALTEGTNTVTCTVIPTSPTASQSFSCTNPTTGTSSTATQTSATASPSGQKYTVTWTGLLYSTKYPIAVSASNDDFTGPSASSSATTLAPPFTGPTPSVTGLSPTSGPITGGTPVKITGSGFTGATSVVLADTPAKSFAVVSDSEIDAVSPAIGGAGPVYVTVTTPGGSSAAVPAAEFTYVTEIDQISGNGSSTSSYGGQTLTGAGSGDAITTGFYSGNPQTASPSFTSSGVYFDVKVSSGSQNLAISLCPPGTDGSVLDYYDSATGQYASVSPPAVYVPGSGGASPCLNWTASGTSTPTLASLTGTVFAVGIAGYVPETPQRLLDTRPTSRIGSIAGPLAAGHDAAITVAGMDGVPSDAVAVALNVTAVNPAGAGNLRVYPDGASLPNASTVNYVPGQGTANFAVVQLPADGKIDVYSAGSASNVVIDVVGFYTSASGLHPQAPVRAIDTRYGTGTTAGTLAAGKTYGFTVTGADGVPIGAAAVLVNVTAIGPSSGGNLRVFPDGAAVPNASSINYVAGQTHAVFDVVQLPADGKIDVVSAGSPVNLAIDVVGYLDSTATLATQTPVRVLDTRPGTDHVGTLNGPLAAGTGYAVKIAGTGNVPSNASAVLLSVTAIGPSTGVGNLRVYPGDASAPNASTLNYAGPSAIANFVIVRLSSTGTINLESSGSSVNVALDVLGWYPGG